MRKSEVDSNAGAYQCVGAGELHHCQPVAGVQLVRFAQLRGTGVVAGRGAVAGGKHQGLWPRAVEKDTKDG